MTGSITVPMMMSNLHPWAQTTAAYRAAVQAASIPRRMLPARTQAVGIDELISEALVILAECALSPQADSDPGCRMCGGDIPDTVRRGAKFCSPQCRSRYGTRQNRSRAKGFEATAAEARAKTHIGSMWSWPEDKMLQYAVREIGYRLCNFLSKPDHEIPSSQWLANYAGAAFITEDRECVEEWLESHGIHCDGSESEEDLAEAIKHLKRTGAI
jgi:hypothetical protein